MMGPDRLMPHAVEAEEAVLGCVMINPDSYFEVAQFLQPDDFYIHKNRWIWDAFVSLNEQKLPIDIITVSKELENHQQLAEAGGVAYLTQLINCVPTSLHAEAYGRLVAREATRRRMIEAATEVAKLAYKEGADVDKLVGDASAVVAKAQHDKQNRLKPIKDLLSAAYDKLKAMFDDPSLRYGMLTGLIDLDRLTGGLFGDNLIIIAGRPGSGKTALMLDIAKRVGATVDCHGDPKEPKHVAVFSLEMSNDELVGRLLANETKIDVSRIKIGDIKDNEWPTLVQGFNSLGDYTIYLDDTPALTPMQLRAKCRKLDMEVGLDLVIVDYLQLMAADGRTDNRTQEVSSISRGLKQLAKELHVPVIAGAQLSRAIEHRMDKKPVLADLRESGSIEQDSDIVMFITKAEVGNGADINLAKHRSGPVGSFVLFFFREYARFENAETRIVELPSS